MPEILHEGDTDYCDPEPGEADAYRELRPPTTITGREGPVGPRKPSVPSLPALDGDVQGETRQRYDDLAERIDRYREAEGEFDRYIAELRDGDFDEIDSAADAEKARLDRGALLKRRAKLLEDLAEFAPVTEAETSQIRNALPSVALIEDRLAKGLAKLGFDVARRGGDGPYVDTAGRPIAWNGAIRSHKDHMEARGRVESLTASARLWDQYSRDLRDAMDRSEAEKDRHRETILAGL